MPPKKAAAAKGGGGPSKKTENKKKDQVIEVISLFLFRLSRSIYVFVIIFDSCRKTLL